MILYKKNPLKRGLIGGIGINRIAIKDSFVNENLASAKPCHCHHLFYNFYLEDFVSLTPICQVPFFVNDESNLLAIV